MADPKDLKAWIKDPNTRTALTFFQRQGWSPAQASGIVANLQYESGLDPTRPGDGGAAYGIGQWHAPRQEDFQNWMGAPIQGSSLQDQMGFVQHELTNGADGGARKIGKILPGADTPSNAATIFMNGFERPGDRASAYNRSAMAEDLHDYYFPSESDGTAQPQQVTAQPVAPPPVTPSRFPMPRLST